MTSHKIRELTRLNFPSRSSVLRLVTPDWLASLLVASFTFLGCAGPTSPFGALLHYDTLATRAESGSQGTILIESSPAPTLSPSKDPSKRPASRGLASIPFVGPNGAILYHRVDPQLVPAPVRLEVSPNEQVLHKSFDLVLQLHDDQVIPDNFKLKVSYNHLNVTQQFFKKAEKNRVSPNDFKIIFRNVKISPNRINKLTFDYTSHERKRYSVDYSPPVCPWTSFQPILNTESFEPERNWLGVIEQQAETSHINANLLAGLIAQESGFNPRALSRAKAIGLTQITPIAEEEVVEYHPEFPRFPNINGMNFLTLQSLIFLNHIKPAQEWRLNPETSIQGGVTYLVYLHKIWSDSTSLKEFASASTHPYLSDQEKTKLILASYNSGASRVRQAFLQQPKNWLEAQDLKEARKYVSMVTSYCSAFSKTSH